MGQFPLRYKLPTSYSVEIGKITTRFSHVQWQIRQCTYLLLGIGRKEGRLTVREPDVADAITTIEELIKIKKLAPVPNLKALKTRLQQIESYRNKLAHGIWLKHPGERAPVIQETKGFYIPKPGAPKISARLFPRAAKVTLQNLRDIRKGVDISSRELRGLYAGLERQLPPSRGKQPQQLELGLSPTDRRPKGPKDKRHSPEASRG